MTKRIRESVRRPNDNTERRSAADPDLNSYNREFDGMTEFRFTVPPSENGLADPGDLETESEGLPESPVDPESPPEDWESVSDLAQILEITPQQIQSIVGRLAQEHPGDVGVYRGRFGIRSEHISPQLQARVIAEVDLQLAYQAGSIVLSGPEPTVGSASDAKIGRLILVQSGQLVIHEGILAPADWEMRSAVAQRLGVSLSVLIYQVNRLGANHPEWFENFKTPSGRVVEHLAPELVVELEVYFAERNQTTSSDIRSDAVIEPATPEELADPLQGWTEFYTLATKIGEGVSQMVITQQWEQCVGSHPEWFKWVDPEVGEQKLYCHPDFVEVVRAKLTSIREQAAVAIQAGKPVSNSSPTKPKSAKTQPYHQPAIPRPSQAALPTGGGSLEDNEEEPDESDAETGEDRSGAKFVRDN
ncbi:MAG: hypothetical protein V1826_00360 [bacterium]